MSETLTIQNVPFMGDEIPATIDNGIIWCVVNSMAKNIGLTEDQCKKQSRNIQNDLVLQNGAKKLSVVVGTQGRECLCIQSDYVPLWLAKISITPTMKEENPNAVKKLVQYQLKVKDALTDYFYGNKNRNINPYIPLTREELAAYMLYTERHTDTIEKMMSSFIDNQTAVQNNTYNSMIQIITGFAESATATMNTMRSIAESMKSTMDSMATLPSANNDVLPEQNVCIDDERWKQSAYDKVNQIAKIIGNTSGNAVLIKIYNLIKINDGIDLAKYKKDYMRDNNIAAISIISMIATNKELRKLFEKHADNYFEDVMSKKPSVIQSEKEEESKRKPISAIALKVPDSIIAEISPLAEKYGRSINSVFRPVYKEMELQSGLNLDNICTLYAEKLHISNVCKGYAISQDDQLMQIFRKAIKSLMERGLAK